MSKTKSAKKTSSKAASANSATHITTVRPPTEPNPDCPYRAGTLYSILFAEGSKEYLPKPELIRKVANMTGKSEKVVCYAYQVLKSKGHRSNNNRSSVLTEGDKVKIIAIKK